MKVRFVVDSASDVPQHYVDRYGMYVIPLYVNYGGNSYADNGQDLNRLEYYQLLKTIDPIPQTSAPCGWGGRGGVACRVARI
jgi:fatty acid-binding protein DegV